VETHHFIERDFAAAQRGRDLALVMFGFAHFERFSEEVGSAAADAAVVEFGRVLARMTRRMNMSVRCGWRTGAFLSVLSGGDADAARMFVLRVREAAAKVEPGMPPIQAGIAVYQPQMRSPEELVQEAERSLAAAEADPKAADRPPHRGPSPLERGDQGAWRSHTGRTLGVSPKGFFRG